MVDYVNLCAYPYKLEQLLKAATDNENLRIYNIGYSGHRFKSVISHYDDIFGHAYADVKMVGIVFGINDRLTTNEKAYYEEFRENLVYTVEYLYAKGIQPFMVTTQATVEPHCPTTLDSRYYPMRDSESINTVANGIKREVAEEYGLEVIDMNAYGEFMMNYSQIPMDDICTDNIHFKDRGHTFESEYLYSVLCGRCDYAHRGDVLTFASQKMKSQFPSDYVSNFETIKDGFKLYAQHSRNDTTDIVLQDFVIYVDEKEPVTLSAFCIVQIRSTFWLMMCGMQSPTTNRTFAHLMLVCIESKLCQELQHL
jgi:lysophospholipase L1-like esterase